MGNCDGFGAIREQRKRGRESRALVYAATLRRNSAAVKLNEMSHNRETESKPAETPRRGTISLTKAIEHTRQKLSIDSLTRVFHRHTRVRSLLVDAHRDLSALRCKLHRIRQQVPDDLMQAGRVGRDRTHSRFGVIIDDNPLSIRRGLHYVDRRPRN